MLKLERVDRKPGEGIRPKRNHALTRARVITNNGNHHWRSTLDDSRKGLQKDSDSSISSLLRAVADTGLGDDEPAPGTRINGRYEVIRRLGTGGMGIVLLARDLELERRVACKVIRPRLLAHDDTGRMVDVFLREAKATARLNHRNIISIYDVGRWRDQPYIVMELLEGQPPAAGPLSGIIRQTTMPAVRAVDIVVQVTTGIAYAHQRGILHRDLTPGNVFLLRDGTAKIVDFGMAAFDTAQGTLLEAVGSDGSGPSGGTPGHMAPEQCRNEAQDERTDIWALGVLLYELLSGEHPFDPRTARRGPDQATSGPALPPRFPPELDRLVGKALQRDPPDRFQTADELLQALLPVRARLASSKASRVPSARQSEISAVDKHVADPTDPLLVGRDREWAVLREGWDEARSGNGRMLLVTGEAGIGKSHLVEALAVAASRDGAQIARARCYEAEGRLSWGPITDLLRSDALRPRIGWLQEVWIRELSRLLPELRAGRPEDAVLPAIADPAQRKVLFEAIGRAILGAEEPLLLVVDDLQWCDRDTIEFLHYLLRPHRRDPILLAGTARPDEIDEDHPLNPLCVALQRDGVLTKVALSPLDAKATAELAAGLTGTALDEATAARLFRETEGNPLFVVEAVRAGMARADATQLESPTVLAVIQARLSKLSAPARRLVEVAATVGRQFSIDILVGSGAGDEDAVVAALEELWQRQIIREHRHGYDFSHDKIREVAYDRTSPVRRRHLHRNIAAALERLHAHNLDPVSARLAAHYEATGLYGAAIDAHRRAAEHALRVFAIDDAIDTLKRALELLDQLPEGREQEELSLLLALGPALMTAHGWSVPEAETVYTRARELCRHTGAPSQHFAATWGMWLSHQARADHQAGRDFAAELIGLVHHGKDPDLLLQAHHANWTTLLFTGELDPAWEHVRRGLSLYKPDEHGRHALSYGGHDPGVCGKAQAGMLLWLKGYPDQALKSSEEALALAEALGHAPSVVHALHFSARLGTMRREAEATLSLAEASAAAAKELGLAYYLASADVIRGWALTALGNGPAGMPRLNRGLASLRALGSASWGTNYRFLVADAFRQQGQLGNARRMLDEAFDLLERTAERFWEAELYRLKGELLLSERSSGSAESENLIQTALAIAQTQGAKALELRAAATLARLWSHQGKDREARDLLAPVYGWFTEGSDTLDMIEAKTLLEGLS